MNGHPDTPLTIAVRDIVNEYKNATLNYPEFASLHEGYAILQEEVDELWDEIKKKPSKREPQKLRAEVKQVAAMALRFMIELTESSTQSVVPDHHSAPLVDAQGSDDRGSEPVV